ncbi:hypothetical protein DPX16_3305 [Anabarilius grahami]|uniref:Uncharacterized protein n=1 Tax=Anabarilius grahami TaxID=495550 RepID=A0A3N0XN10_ANAGA|nr:hypothetical protein DPX16_3305 [Anabarilius grahami]
MLEYSHQPSSEDEHQEQRDQMEVKKKRKESNEVEEKHHFITGGKSLTFSQTEAKKSFACHQCGEFRT